MPRMILHKLSTQRVKRCPTGCGYFPEHSRDDSRRIIPVLEIMSDLPE